MEKLFKESDMISDKRPTEVGERKRNEYFLKMAKEAIANGWLDSSEILEGAEALMQADHDQDAYSLSRDLEDTFNVDSNFVGWVGCVWHGITDMLNELIKEWVLIKKPKPKFDIYSNIVVKVAVFPFAIGEVLYIWEVTDRAEYKISRKSNLDRYFIFTFEELESLCEAINSVEP